MHFPVLKKVILNPGKSLNRMNVEFFKDNSYKISELITKKYSTSFSLATSLLEKEKRKSIYAIYGFVRFADEIVDSFNGYDKETLLSKLNEDLNYALQNGISTNPVLLAFVDTVSKYNIYNEHIDAFMESMKLDLSKRKYKTKKELDHYIYGSADVVGLMCLKIFCNGDDILYQKLSVQAQSLGSAFQKVNFLRDLKTDMNNLGRKYFPELNNSAFTQDAKELIEKSIENDFSIAYEGIKQLPGKSKLSVLLAYYYYICLLKKIKKTPVQKVLSTRIRISNMYKYFIILKVYFAYKLKLI